MQAAGMAMDWKLVTWAAAETEEEAWAKVAREEEVMA